MGKSGTGTVCHFCFSGMKLVLLPTSQETRNDQDFDLLMSWSIEEQDAFIINILIHLSCSNLLHKPRIIPQRSVEDKSFWAVLWVTEPGNAGFLQIWVLCLLNSASSSLNSSSAASIPCSSHWYGELTLQSPQPSQTGQLTRLNKMPLFCPLFSSHGDVLGRLPSWGVCPLGSFVFSVKSPLRITLAGFKWSWGWPIGLESLGQSNNRWINYKNLLSSGNGMFLPPLMCGMEMQYQDSQTTLWFMAIKCNTISLGHFHVLKIVSLCCHDRVKSFFIFQISI